MKHGKRSSSVPNIIELSIFKQNSQSKYLKNSIMKNKNKDQNCEPIVLATRSSPSSITVKFSNSLGVISTSSSLNYHVLIDRNKIRNLSLASYSDSVALSSLKIKKEKLQMQICRIKVLLVSMSVALGLSMFIIGLYFKVTLPSLRNYECGYWAAIPILLNGFVNIFFCIPKFQGQYQRRKKLMKIKIMSLLLSAIAAVSSLTASIICGRQGNWIVYHHNKCRDFSLPSNATINLLLNETKHYFKIAQRFSPIFCCQDQSFFKSKKSHCLCGATFIQLPNKFLLEIFYGNVSCKYVLSSLKDYFILQCALFAVASGVCVWLGLLLRKKIFCLV